MIINECKEIKRLFQRWNFHEDSITAKSDDDYKNLQLHGYEAYAVGGCVRDSILARRPKDWDITTSARPEEVKKLFRRTVDTGIEHGTVTVLLGRDGYEVTTYRIDGAYEDSRHPKRFVYKPIRGRSAPQRFYDQCNGI